MVLNSGGPMLDALLEGRGLAWSWRDRIRPYLADGRVAQVLDDWCEPFGLPPRLSSWTAVSAVFALVTEHSGGTGFLVAECCAPGYGRRSSAVEPGGEPIQRLQPEATAPKPMTT